MAPRDASRMVVGQGQDDRLLPAPNSAGQIINMRWDPGGWWASDRGWEPLLERPADYLYTEDYLAPMRFFRVWTKHQGAEVYYLYERSGSLQYDYGNDNQGTEDSTVVLDTGRHVPPPDDPGTQLAPYGRFALLLNGHNGPLKFFGGSLVTPFGFPSAPPPPVVLPVDPEIKDSVFTAAGNTGVADNSCAIGKLGITPQFPGDLTASSDSSYAIRVSWVSETGSESPLSEEAVVSWQMTAAVGTTLAIYMGLPVGPANVVACRIYATKNMGDGTGLVDRTLYFVGQVDGNTADAYVHVLADTRLSVAAPELTASRTLPPGLRFAAAFDGRLWLAGGAHCETRVIYSNVDAPEQFGALAFYELGSAESGAITALAAQDGRLYVFRERGIDEITVNQFDATYSQRTLSTLVGTTAANTIRAVPGFGLVFLSRDGIYALRAGKEPERISDGISGEMARIGAGSLARATAAWSTREGEYWVAYPADGSTENTRGAVLHARRSTPDRPAWSLRHITPTDGDSVYRTIVTAIDCDPEGWLVFGTCPIDLTTGDYPGTSLLTSLLVAAIGPPPVVASVLENLGLQVWSARPASGTRYTVTAVGFGEDDHGFVTSQVDSPKIESVYQSAWEQFETRGRVLRVEVWMLNTGRPSMTLEYAVDGREEWTPSALAPEAGPAETSRTATADHVYATDANASKRGYQATWGASKWREDRLVRVRWDVDVDVGAVGSFAFRLRTSDIIGIVGHRTSSLASGIGTGRQGED